jgi:aspartyl-tRNA synthetase
MSRYLALEVVGRVGEVVTIKGWVNARRDMGKIAFFDVRDRSGIVQVVGVPSQLDDASKERMKGIRLEYCVAITGTVQPRQPGGARKSRDAHGRY